MTRKYIKLTALPNLVRLSLIKNIVVLTTPNHDCLVLMRKHELSSPANLRWYILVFSIVVYV